MKQINPMDAEIDHILTELSKLAPDSEEYTKAAENLKVLSEARSKKPYQIIEPEAILMAGVNILGIVLILYFERFNVISSRAMSFIIKR